MLGFSFEIHKIICTNPRAPRSDIPKLKTKDDETQENLLEKGKEDQTGE
jgi:hypothetical protein